MIAIGSTPTAPPRSPGLATASLRSGPTASGTTAFTFDDFGSLRGVTLADGRSITYLVDADGRRIGREVGGKLVAGYLYDPAGRVVAETDGTGAVVMQFGYDELGHLAVVQGGSTTYRVVTDPAGSPRLVINTGSGAVVDAITYDAWGRITSESAPGTIPFGFAGGLADPDTGLVHFGARDYDPATGTWTGPDPIQFAGGDPNLYQYAGSDPVNHVDPSGLISSTARRLAPASSMTYLTSARHVPSGEYPTHPWPRPTPHLRLHRQPSGSSVRHCHMHWLVCRFLASGCVVGNLFDRPERLRLHGLICMARTSADFARLARSATPTSGPATASTSISRAPASSSPSARPTARLTVQARQEAPSHQSSVSFNTAVAANVDGDRVGVYAREPAFLVVNGTAFKAPDIEERLPHGGLLERHGGQVVVTWTDGSRLTVTLVGQHAQLRLRIRARPSVRRCAACWAARTATRPMT